MTHRSAGVLALVLLAFAGLAVAAPAAAPDAPRISSAPSRVELIVDATAGHADIAVDGMPRLLSARFATSELAQPARVRGAIPVDGTPDSPYNDLSQVRTYIDYPTSYDLASRPRLFFAQAEGRGAQVRVIMGIDDDNDGRIEAGEERCRGAVGDVSECSFARTSKLQRRWWIIVQAVSGDASDVVYEFASVDIGCTPACDASQLRATGPGKVPAGEPFTVRLGWDEPALAKGIPLVGALQVQYIPGAAVANVPIRLVPRSITPSAIALPDEGRVIFLPPGRTHDRMFIDVPPGAKELLVGAITLGRTSDDQRFTVTLVRAGEVPRGPQPGPTPDADGGRVGDRYVRIANPMPGRWFAIFENTGPITAHLETYSRVASGMSIGRGSYYNPERPGHGVFVYPVGAEGALLWYTYDDAGRPTWYYAQGPRDAAVWAWPLYRAAWDEVTRFLQPVGRVVLTPRTADGGISFTYDLDGVTGSEALEPWLSGCPMFDGAPLAVSTHWYDEAMPGYGYSVQVNPAYELIASFVYDARGEPRFLVAERGGAFDAASSPLPLYQMHGFAPMAPWQAPTRTQVGVLGRVYARADIETIGAEATFVDGVPGGWSYSAPVTRLGNPQACNQ